MAVDIGGVIVLCTRLSAEEVGCLGSSPAATWVKDGALGRRAGVSTGRRGLGWREKAW